MATVVEDLLRLAWQVDGDGLPNLRDALLTLAVAEGVSDGDGLGERCRRVLVANHPGHWFAASVSPGDALRHPKVAAALVKLRAMFPPVRVRHLLLRGDAKRGAFTGLPRTTREILGDLARPRDESLAPALPFPAPGQARPDNADPDGSLAALYLAVLLAMAVLLKSVVEPASRDGKAA